jgi:hypothetical protein
MHDMLARQLFRFLRRMDAEATPLRDGTPTGLHGYKGFVDGAFQATRGTPWENAWSNRIVDLLDAEGSVARRECRYLDGGRNRCDIVIDQPAALPVWIEVKGCWRVLVDETSNLPGGPNKAFVKHLYRAAHDVEKLRSIAPTDASHLGLLLVGFDTAAHEITPEHLQILRGETAGWAESSDSWPDGAYPGFRIRCWLWSTRCAGVRSEEV